jgi:hypothetical protein
MDVSGARTPSCAALAVAAQRLFFSIGDEINTLQSSCISALSVRSIHLPPQKVSFLNNF